RALELPGGVVLVGGGAILPGITELAQEIFGVNTKLYVPNQIGIRNPSFAHVISIVEYVGGLDEVEKLAQVAVNGEADLRQKPVDIPVTSKRPALAPNVPKVVAQEPQGEENVLEDTPVYVATDDEEPKTKIGERIRGIFGSMFE
ncbi:MAG: cell division protein FtsA C-terminal domain-containing protein, partial [Streptococcus minor]|nr:cell division protein FtsA C-terminal domain-containing protein [Streptococcus minor]